MTVEVSGARCPSCGYSPEDNPLYIPEHTFRIEKLLQSNEPSNDNEENAFRKFVIDGQSQIDYLECRINRVKETALEETKLAVAEHKRMLNPVKRLPSEVLGHIFLHEVGLEVDAAEYFSSASHSLNLKTLPWVYGYVCSFWKAVSISTPLLWTRVKVLKSLTGGSRTASALALLSLYVARSDSLPLTIYMDISENDLSSSSDSSKTVGASSLSALLLTQSRRSLYLAEGQGVLSTAMLFSQDSFPSLKNLQVQELSGRSKRFSITVTAPSLTSWSSIGDVSASSIRVKLSNKLCSQITEYSVSQASASDVWSIVKKLPHLKKLRVRELKPENPRIEFDSFQPLLLRAPGELFLEQSSYEMSGVGIFVASIVCPAVEALAVKSTRPFSEAIQKLEKRSSFNLKRIDVTACTGIFTLMNSVPLEILTIRGIGETSDYDPFLSLQDVLSHLKPEGHRQSRSNVTVPDISSEKLASSPTGSPQEDLSAQREAVVDLSSSISPSSSAKMEDSQSAVPFPNLRRLELHLSSSAIWENCDIMEEVLTCIVARSLGDSGGEYDSITPREVSISAPDDQAKKTLTHRGRDEMLERGVKVEIAGL
ncbi:hypothetical protein GYMLUDRAFT_260436 [Collybiopsis luxurians FD-317 M1]|uniref:F-box domain-containing protein n=1 Tax=Collybiopsis luxurians FD-317 M1 TaxID=944289 RepID=A0A0D0CRI3_9AGAR|nr:hypothetical protein GYMLUDRAFT_260436 [Collybiopsis luxurians FD-317 M1]